MTDPMISIQDAVALGLAVPDILTTDGDASVKHRALAVDIKRTDKSWKVSFVRQENIFLASGRVVPRTLEPFIYDLADVAGKTVTLKHPDGREFVFPAVLAQAIIAQFYVDRELEKKV